MILFKFIGSGTVTNISWYGLVKAYFSFTYIKRIKRFFCRHDWEWCDWGEKNILVDQEIKCIKCNKHIQFMGKIIFGKTILIRVPLEKGIR